MSPWSLRAIVEATHRGGLKFLVNSTAPTKGLTDSEECMKTNGGPHEPRSKILVSELPKIRGPYMAPKIVGLLFSGVPKKGPLISEPPI